MKKEFEEFNSSIDFDRLLYQEDIEGSIAYVKALQKAGVITDKELQKIVDALQEIKDEIRQEIPLPLQIEDIHTAIEHRLTEKLGEVGKKLHTGRSRNEQVVLDERMYLKKEIKNIVEVITSLQKAIVKIAKDNIDLIMPGYTHLQQAQPILFSHYILSLAFMLRRDKERLLDCYKRMDTCPLGSGAIAGNPYNLDRKFLAKELNFSKVSENSIDAVSDRDFILEFLSSIAILMMHLSRFSEDFIIWSSSEFGFIEIDDSLCSSSSLMPQKKNPDSLELIRGKTGRVFGNLFTLLTVLKGLPLTYNKDIQEDKEPLFDTISTVLACLKIFKNVMATLKFNKEKISKSINSYLLATDLADYLVKKGIPFRESHKIVSLLIRYAIEKNKSLKELSINEYHSFSNKFCKDIYDILDYKVSVERRNLKNIVKKEIQTLANNLL
ncbi:argininosuccinate lyase [candidate division WOR-3 bacterium]|nr:argininosuccinate lyase [candidate division WOR-3 bacterium]